MLQGEASLLLDLLQGKSPSKATTKDKRGWGSLSGSFTVSEGYKRIIAVPYAPPNPAQWKFIWDFPSLPKIDFFCWTVAHQSILTRDNLRRRGMEGPSRCPLCLSDEETLSHLLLLCPFAQEVWRGNFSRRKLQSYRVISKIKALLGEALEANTSSRNETSLVKEEEQWLKDLIPNLKERPVPPALSQANWEIRLEELEFIKWRLALDDHCLFFDGASKGNPGVAGSGGVLLSPGGFPELRFHWGLGIETNNRAEALALWQGLSLAINRNILSLSVFGDSRLIIQALLFPKSSHQVHLATIIRKIRLLLPKFNKISFFHILRTLNSQADLEANLGSLCSRRSLVVNSIESSCAIP
eukprot:PITA_24317